MALSDRFTGCNSGYSAEQVQMSKILLQAPLSAPPFPPVFSHQSCEIAALPLPRPRRINYDPHSQIHTFVEQPVHQCYCSTLCGSPNSGIHHSPVIKCRTPIREHFQTKLRCVQHQSFQLVFICKMLLRQKHKPLFPLPPPLAPSLSCKLRKLLEDLPCRCMCLIYIYCWKKLMLRSTTEAKPCKPSTCTALTVKQLVHRTSGN